MASDDDDEDAALWEEMPSIGEAVEGAAVVDPDDRDPNANVVSSTYPNLNTFTQVRVDGSRSALIE